MVKNVDDIRVSELYLFHEYEEIELFLKYVERTLPYVVQLFGGECSSGDICRG